MVEGSRAYPTTHAIIAVDPSAYASGYVIVVHDRMWAGTCELTTIENVIAAIDIPDGIPIALAVECETRMYRGSVHVTRVAANLWLKALKKRFGRRLVLCGQKGAFVTPKAWRDMILCNTPAVKAASGRDEWKARAMWYADKIGNAKGLSEDEAEAFAIAAYASVRFIQCNLDHTKPKQSNRSTKRSTKA